MYWIYIINNYYCVIERANNTIVAKFKYLEQAMQYIKEKSLPANVNHINPIHNCHFSNHMFNNNDMNNKFKNETNDNKVLKDIEEQLNKITEKLMEFSNDDKKIWNEIRILKAKSNKKTNQIVDLKSADITKTIFDDDNLDVSLDKLIFSSHKKNKKI